MISGIGNVIEARNLSFTYEGETEAALKDVNFAVPCGTLIFISGASGAGKSTLLNIINGLIPEVTEGKLSGELLIDGCCNMKMHKRSFIIGNVFQNPRSQFFTTNTTAELVFAMENFGVDRAEMEHRLNEIVNKYDLGYLLNRDIFGLSSGERQMLALATALIMNPRVIIFDEPSANLDYGNAMRLRRQLAELKHDGKTIVVADHRFFYLRGLIDSVLLLENGTTKKYESEAAYFSSDYAARAANLFEEEYDERIITKSSAVDDVKLEAVSYKGILDNISVLFRRNEITTVIGVNGAGKTTVARLISGVLKADKGVIDTNGQALYIMQDADYQLFGASCLKELLISSRDEELNLATLDELKLGELKESHPHSLSGGEKQRLQMAISKVSNNRVIILDEPTSGLDKESMRRVTKLLESMKLNHTVIVISHDYEFIRNVADRIVYLSDGRIKDSFYLEKENIWRLNEIFKEMEDFYE